MCRLALPTRGREQGTGRGHGHRLGLAGRHEQRLHVDARGEQGHRSQDQHPETPAHRLGMTAEESQPIQDLPAGQGNDQHRHPGNQSQNQTGTGSVVRGHG